jgi:phage replication O-like protein O
VKPPKKRTPKEVDYFTGVVMLNDFIDYEMPHLKPAEVKLALVIFRKTIGWGKFSDQIGTTQFCKLAKLDKDTVKDAIHNVCEKVGIMTEQQRENGVLPRRRYTWPMNERVKATLDKTQGKKGGGQITPEGGGQNPPTQLNPYQLVPFGDLSFYSDEG